MMTIVLLHSHYDESHLEEVKTEMKSLGSPKIKGIWDEARSMWIALEGCHRIRAAKDLGLEPEMIDVGEYDDDGYIDYDALSEKRINELTDESNLQDDPESTVGEHLDYVGQAYGLELFDFEEAEVC